MPTRYVARSGDCMNSIAEAFGFHPKTLWEHPDNADLRALRKDPDVLAPGDVVAVPDKTVTTYTRPTGAAHTFRRKDIPAKLRLRVLDAVTWVPADAPPPDPDSGRIEGPRPSRAEEKPLANAPYRLTVEGVEHRGTTDGDGFLEASIAPSARSGVLVLEPGTPRERQMDLMLGRLDPVATVAGVKQRLQNLGFPAGAEGDAVTEDLARALRSFQAIHALPVTGEADDATRDALLAQHGN